MWNIFKQLFGGGKTQQTQVAETRTSAIQAVDSVKVIDLSNDLCRPNGHWDEVVASKTTTTHNNPYDISMRSIAQRHLNNAVLRGAVDKVKGEFRVKHFNGTQRSLNKMRQAAISQTRTASATSNHHGTVAQQALLTARQQQEEAFAQMRRIEAEEEERRRRRNEIYDLMSISNTVNAVLSFSSSPDPTPDPSPSFDGGGGTFDGGGASSNWD